jgi:hypothetical protein
MFNFMSSFFKTREKEPEQFKNDINNQQDQIVQSAEIVPIDAVRDNSIRHDPHLIEELKSDHIALVNLFGRIWTEGYEAQDYPKMARLISELKRNFQAHILKENVRFYVYLEQHLEHDQHNLEIVKEFRSDMNGIAHTVVKFCKRYSSRALNPVTIANFKEEYMAIGEALTHRVELEEEDLYTLYDMS